MEFYELIYVRVYVTTPSIAMENNMCLLGYRINLSTLSNGTIVYDYVVFSNSQTKIVIFKTINVNWKVILLDTFYTILLFDISIVNSISIQWVNFKKKVYTKQYF